MKIKMIQQGCLALAVALLLPVAAPAGGTGHIIAKFEPMNSEQISQLKPGNTVVKVCRGCGALQLIQVEKSGEGMDYTTKKCQYCGSENTYLAGSKQPIPFKDQLKP
jgi:hypothetical protein